VAVVCLFTGAVVRGRRWWRIPDDAFVDTGSLSRFVSWWKETKKKLVKLFK